MTNTIARDVVGKPQAITPASCPIPTLTIASAPNALGQPTLSPQPSPP
ncbi:MAG: hypothetical protein JSR92_18400 [Proteobacteria bacterium]|nr:hypothetical protein [Pseudomonadota bacterium]